LLCYDLQTCVLKRAAVSICAYGQTLLSCLCFTLHAVSYRSNRQPYNLYCVGADVKPCSINLTAAISILSSFSLTDSCGLDVEEPAVEVVVPVVVLVVGLPGVEVVGVELVAVVNGRFTTAWPCSFTPTHSSVHLTSPSFGK